MMVVGLSLLGIVGFIVYKNRVIPETKSDTGWVTREGIRGFFAGNGMIADMQQGGGGIYILPENYENKKKDFKVKLTNPTTGDVVEKTILSEVDEFTNIKVLPNEENSSRWWLVVSNLDGCEAERKKQEKVAHTQEIMALIFKACNFKLMDFNLDSGELKQVAEYITSESLRYFYPLVHDAKNGIIWFATSKDEELEGGYYDEEGKEIKTKGYATNFVYFDEKANEFNSYFQTGYSLTGYGWGNGWSPYSLGLSGIQSLVGVDGRGNLYAVVTCSLTCGTRGERVLKIPKAGSGNYQIEEIPIPEFARIKGEFGASAVQITVDRDSSVLYTATNTWNQSQDSFFAAYEGDRKRWVKDVGGMPTRSDDDVRGFTVLEGKMLIGTFDGLGVYDLDTDKWKLIKETDGLLNNNVLLVGKGPEGKLCLIHEQGGTSCLRETLSEYLSRL